MYGMKTCHFNANDTNWSKVTSQLNLLVNFSSSIIHRFNIIIDGSQFGRMGRQTHKSSSKLLERS